MEKQESPNINMPKFGLVFGGGGEQEKLHFELELRNVDSLGSEAAHEGGGFLEMRNKCFVSLRG